MNISISRIRLFLSCRRAYELKYIYKVEPEVKATALQEGTNYHEKIEDLYNGKGIDTSDLSKPSAMAKAYEKYIYPMLPVKYAEKWVRGATGVDDVTLIGRVDGIAEDGCLVEHKTTGAANIDEYEFRLDWDSQILAYMYMTGCRKMYYTICRKPTIRQKKNESAEEFYERMVAWYDENTDEKIRMVEIYRTDEEVNSFVSELKNIAQEMKDTKLFYKNTCHCNSWGRPCEYSSICLHYDPEMDYVGFKKGEK